MNYTNYYNKKRYSPKKPVGKFTDLEVYQKSLECAVFVGKEIVRGLKNKPSTKSKTQTNTRQQHFIELFEQEILHTAFRCSQLIPHLFAESNSKRFGESNESIEILDQIMFKCNKMVVYLEQIRDIINTNIESNRFNEQIEKYHYIRTKTLNLQRTWKKFRRQKTNDLYVARQVQQFKKMA